MARVTVFINGREYQVACDDGQEEHLRRLAQEVDERVRQLGYTMGQAGESLLLVLASLMMADELHDIRRELTALRREITHTSQSFEQSKLIEMESAISTTIEEIAARIEKIAEHMENG